MLLCSTKVKKSVKLMMYIILVCPFFLCHCVCVFFVVCQVLNLDVCTSSISYQYIMHAKQKNGNVLTLFMLQDLTKVFSISQSRRPQVQKVHGNMNFPAEAGIYSSEFTHITDLIFIIYLFNIHIHSTRCLYEI